MQYAYNGGAWTSLAGLDPASPYDLSAGGTKSVPENFRFGFGASTGGAYNIHELTCFAANMQCVRQTQISRQQMNDHIGYDQHTRDDNNELDLLRIGDCFCATGNGIDDQQTTHQHIRP